MAAMHLVFDRVSFPVGGGRVFSAASFEMGPGQHWSVLGPNGSGKSALAKAICGKVPIVGGQVEYTLREVPDAPLVTRPYLLRNEALLLSEETHRHFMRRFSGYHQARWQSSEARAAPLVGELLTADSIERISDCDVTPLRVPEEIYDARRERAVELLGIEHLMDRRIMHVSHGESRKVQLARALMQAPQLLVLDSPFGGLDNASRQILMQALNALLSAGGTRVVVVTSRVDEIPGNTTHVLRVVDHRVVAQGPRDEVLGKAHEVDRARPGRTAWLASELPTFDAGDGVGEHPLIAMNEVSVAYGDVRVLDKLSWTVRRGEHWAVLGHNGAGKSTLLSLVMADNPQVYACDMSVLGIRRGPGERIEDLKRRIGSVSPELQLHYRTGRTCADVVNSGFLDTVGVFREATDEQKEVARQWMRAMGIEDLAGKLYRGVSAGEQRLVLLARAMVKRPALLILDEPCQGLDEELRSRILALLDEVCRNTPVSMVFVTHHFDEMPESISHVLLLEEGRVRACGPREEIA